MSFQLVEGPKVVFKNQVWSWYWTHNDALQKLRLWPFTLAWQSDFCSKWSCISCNHDLRKNGLILMVILRTNLTIFLNKSQCFLLHLQDWTLVCKFLQILCCESSQVFYANAPAGNLRSLHNFFRVQTNFLAKPNLYDFQIYWAPPAVIELHACISGRNNEQVINFSNTVVQETASLLPGLPQNLVVSEFESE